MLKLRVNSFFTQVKNERHVKEKNLKYAKIWSDICLHYGWLLLFFNNLFYWISQVFCLLFPTIFLLVHFHKWWHGCLMFPLFVFCHEIFNEFVRGKVIYAALLFLSLFPFTLDWFMFWRERKSVRLVLWLWRLWTDWYWIIIWKKVFDKQNL